MKHLICTLVALFSLSSFAADVNAIKKIFETNFNTFYVPTRCGQNTQRLITEAHKQKVDLSNSYVMRFVGGGFWETSGFYMRGSVNDRSMLGYFHMVFVADGYVFDFDLDEPLVLKLEDYIRLQFAPPYTPFQIYPSDASLLKELSSWELTRYETMAYMKNTETVVWKKKMAEVLDVKKALARKRVR